VCMVVKNILCEWQLAIYPALTARSTRLLVGILICYLPHCKYYRNPRMGIVEKVCKILFAIKRFTNLIQIKEIEGKFK